MNERVREIRDDHTRGSDDAGHVRGERDRGHVGFVYVLLFCPKRDPQAPLLHLHLICRLHALICLPHLHKIDLCHTTHCKFSPWPAQYGLPLPYRRRGGRDCANRLDELVQQYQTDRPRQQSQEDLPLLPQDDHRNSAPMSQIRQGKERNEISNVRSTKTLASMW